MCFTAFDDIVNRLWLVVMDGSLSLDGETVGMMPLAITSQCEVRV